MTAFRRVWGPFGSARKTRLSIRIFVRDAITTISPRWQAL